MDVFYHEHKTSQSRLFTDYSKTGLKTVLLHNWSKFSSVPLAYATNMKETYENLITLLEKFSMTGIVGPHVEIYKQLSC
jgi:hypothetical protein